MFVLGIIPARGGSKEIKDKNIKELGGLPLIVHTIRAAKGSKLLSDCIVSTDSERIADVARRYGAKIPFLRPAELATDTSPTIDALLHALNFYEQEEGRRVEAIMILQPTAPFRESSDIDGAIELFSKGKAESLISCFEEDESHPVVMYVPDGDLVKPLLSDKDVVMRRQDFPTVYTRNGAIYLMTRELLVEKRRIRADRSLCYVMPKVRSANIDDMMSFAYAEFLFKWRTQYEQA